VDACAPAEWQVEFTPGRISAKAYRRGKCVAKAEQRTAGKPYAIRLAPATSALKNDGADTAIVNCCVVDKHGVVVPYANNLIRFDIEGDGYVRGVGNGDPNSHELDNVPYRRAFAGMCQALVTAHLGAKSLSIRAHSEGLEPCELRFELESVPAPLFPKNITNYILEGFTMSEVTEEKPDATAEIADNDMNSFTPIQFVKDVFQSDFRNGWRIYRTKPKAAKDGVYRLDFLRARFTYGEIYVDGVLVDRIDAPVRGGYVSAPFSITAGSTPDIRILLRVDNEITPAAGISGRVEMKETK
jgi:hypothetical protein